MSRIALSVALVLVGAISLGLKVNASSRANDTLVYPEQDDIVSLLEHHGFVIEFAAPNADPKWVTGTRPDCRMQIANVSPQGWHRNIVKWAGADRLVQYSAGGVLQPEQPLVGPLLHHYLNRLKRYAGIDAPPVKVRAILFDKNCAPDAIPAEELAALSG
ncbi:MAG: hypothetical protein KF874_07625 [Rhizobiaceae bacterium]|nr:hypothetical protein [Rhizobiaceae bacterium]